MKKTLLITVFVLTFAGLYAQQEAMYTHYMFNTLAVNPAYAGSRNALTFTGLHRSQWVGFEGAPTTQTFTVHTPIYAQNAGLGFSVINDKNGFVNTASIYLDAAYRIRVAKRSWLSFGLKGGFNMRNANLTSVTLDNPADPDFQNDLTSAFLPNFGAGIYYYTPKFYAGLSSPKVLENNFDANTVSNLSKEQRHFFLIAGYLAKLNQSWKLKPTTFLKVTPNAPAELDLSAQLIYNDRVWVGGMFRTGDAAGVLLGMFLSRQLSVGYSFDWSYSNKTFVNHYGSHEVVVRYDLGFCDGKKRSVVSPRYF